MKTETRILDHVCVVDVEGPIIQSNCQEFRDRIVEDIKQGWRKMALNLAGVEYMDSAGLAVLVEILHEAKRRNSDLRFYALTQPVRSLLEITNLHRIMPLCDDENAMLDLLNQKTS